MNIPILLGSILLFIYSINKLSEELKILSIKKVKSKLDILTNSTKKSISLGFIMTSLIQSGSATLMITMSLINAKLLDFNNSIGIVLGSNFASSLTSFLIGLNLEKIASFIMLLGLIIGYFKSNIKKYSKTIFYLGLAFFSLSLTTLSLKNLQNNSLFSLYVQNVSNSFILSILVGFLITIIFQSSSIFVALLQVLALSNVLSIYNAIPFIFGSNIGTTIDLFYGISSSKKDAKKLAIFNLLFNILITIVFSIFIKPFSFILTCLTNLFKFNKAINISLINILFNALGVLLILPFLNKIKRYFSKW